MSQTKPFMHERAYATTMPAHVHPPGKTCGGCIELPHRHTCIACCLRLGRACFLHRERERERERERGQSKAIRLKVEAGSGARAIASRVCCYLARQRRKSRNGLQRRRRCSLQVFDDGAVFFGRQMRQFFLKKMECMCRQIYACSQSRCRTASHKCIPLRWLARVRV